MVDDLDPGRGLHGFVLNLPALLPPPYLYEFSLISDGDTESGSLKACVLSCSGVFGGALTPAKPDTGFAGSMSGIFFNG